MNKTISIIRISILFILSGIAMIFLFGEEQEENATAFLFRVLFDKAFAFGLFYFVGRLYKRWCKVDPWLRAYEKMCDEVMDNPSQL